MHPDGAVVSEADLRLACAELDRRVRASEGYRAEMFFASRPLLAVSEDAAVELIYTEFVTREEMGQRPTPEEYCAGFPAWQSRLKRQFQVHRVFRDDLASTAIGAAPETRETPATPRRLGGHELLEELARGSGGVVYHARQETLQRTVALKVLRPEPGRKARTRRRFCREAKLLASLRHRNIVAVHDLGEQRGWLWYSMDLAEGGSLAGTSGALEPRRAANLVATIAEVVAYVHGRGIIHCDLKPSNVLLDADGQPLLGDFGLAWVNGESGETRRGLAGTPAYMAPEQIAPDNKVSPATDVWALGVILYELLAGQRPFKGTSLDELGRVICQDAPASLQGSALVLEPVWRRCLIKEPTGRFASAADLAVELRRLSQPD